MKIRILFLLLILAVTAQVAHCERIKDIVDIQGMRGNPLMGIGLVVGLAGTGDTTKPSQRILTNIFRTAGNVFTPDDFAGGNIALVVVEATLGPFDREGSNIDVDVSAVGGAESLRGGKLLPTPLIGLDDQVYAVANGALSLGGWGASGGAEGAGVSIVKNHLLVARIPGGATVERAEIATFFENIAGQSFITLNLRNNDFATAERIGVAINNIYKNSAVALDAGTITVRIPDHITRAGVSGFIVDITKPNVEVDIPAVVVINEKTGTIVVGENVGISPAQAICQGSLIVKIKEIQNVFQPDTTFTEGATTKVVDETLLSVDEKQGYLVPIPRIITVSELAKVLNAIGATPTDLVAIFNALKEAGALQATLKIM
ncbi:flagellar basal body P-ring protein FlgI [Planctomycetota bacterium]